MRFNNDIDFFMQSIIFFRSFSNLLEEMLRIEYPIEYDGSKLSIFKIVKIQYGLNTTFDTVRRWLISNAITFFVQSRMSQAIRPRRCQWLENLLQHLMDKRISKIER